MPADRFYREKPRHPRDLGSGMTAIDLGDALFWLIEHKSCSDFPKCWATAPEWVKTTIAATWGSDPWA